MLDCEENDCRGLRFLEGVADVVPRLLLFLQWGRPFVYDGPLHADGVLEFVREVTARYV